MSEQRRVLVADDDRVSREIVGELLRQAGYEVMFAEDGRSAVDKASTEKPDLVLMDGLMPKLHGFVACKEIKGLAQSPKVILLTAVYTKPSYKWEAKIKFGADDLLTKPIKPDDLLACLEKHLSGVPYIKRQEDSAVPDKTLPMGFAL
jgi:two-component system alkaline phosphatase synthesis response regulator PhoP